MKQYKLPKEFATKWLIALRSGKYKQTRNMLVRKVKNTYEYCCLGVAGVVCGISEKRMLDTGVIYRRKQEDFPEYPKELLASLEKDNLAYKLGNMNDSGVYSFPMIADWLEENVEFY